MSTQTEIDFSRRGEQLRLLDQVQFQRGLGVSPGTLVLVLRVIDSFAGESSWCWASLETMAGRSNLSSRTVHRALKVLCEHYMLRKQARTIQGRTETRYRIVWSNLHAAIDEAGRTAEPGWVDVDPCDSPSDKAYDNSDDRMSMAHDIRDDRTSVAVDVCAPKCGAVVKQTVREPQKNRPFIHASAEESGDWEPTDGKNVNRGSQFGSDPICQAGRCSVRPPENVNNCLHFGSEARSSVHQVDALEEEAILELLSGIICRSEAVRLSRKVDLESAQQSLAEYRHPSNRRAIRGPGALVHRLDFGEWPDKSILTIDRLNAHDAARARQRATQAAQQAEELRRVAKADQRLAELENRFGPTLDAMAADEADRLARECLDEFNYSRFVRGADYRQELLEKIELSFCNKLWPAANNK